MNIVLPENFETEDAPQVLDEARPVLDLPPDAKLHVDNVARTKRGTRIDFTYTMSVPLENGELREMSDVHVEVSSRGDLKFNSHGSLVAYQVEPADQRQLRAIRDNVNKLLASGQIYVAEEGEQVDPDKLRAQGKAWYIIRDEHGNKLLCRAWMS